MASLPEDVADQLQERVEELFVEASMLEAVRLNTVCLDDPAMRFHPTECLSWHNADNRSQGLDYWFDIHNTRLSFRRIVILSWHVCLY